MGSLISRIRRPVKRERADHYVLTMLLSFAGSVLATRLYLSAMGYPQVGGGSLHIAHVLWGGLLLFVATLLPLVLANREIYQISAFVGGVGIGLFIDEVGKFLTRTNDYFYPPAIPIIYAFFLITVLLYLRIRRPPSRDARAELYRALDTFGEVLDHDLEPHELADLAARLRRVAATREQPELARLGLALLRFLESDELAVVVGRPTLLERWRPRLLAWEARWLGRLRSKALITAVLAALGLPALFSVPLAATLAYLDGDALGPALLGQAVAEPSGITLILIRLTLTAIAAIPLLTAAVLLWLGRERSGTDIAFIGLLFSLTIVDLLVFYLDQLQAVSGALGQFVLLLAVLRYRERFLHGARAPVTGAGGTLRSGAAESRRSAVGPG